MFGLFKKKAKSPEVEPQFIVVNLNARIQPMHRGEIFEDPLDELLVAKKIGEVTGGGTLQAQSGEIESCDIEIEVTILNDTTISIIKDKLEESGAPKGSKIIIPINDTELEFGTLEGLAVYLNGKDLDEQVYEDSDSNYVYSELERLTEGKGRVFSYWEGSAETAFYLYGHSFKEMQSLIHEFVNNYPLCQKCRIERIA